MLRIDNTAGNSKYDDQKNSFHSTLLCKMDHSLKGNQAGKKNIRQTKLPAHFASEILVLLVGFSKALQKKITVLRVSIFSWMCFKNIYTCAFISYSSLFSVIGRDSQFSSIPTGVHLFMPGKVATMIVAFLAETAPKFIHAFMFQFVIFQKFFRFKRFSTETTVEFSSRMVVHVFLILPCVG